MAKKKVETAYMPWVDVVLVDLDDGGKTMAIAPFGIGIRKDDRVEIVTESAVVSGTVSMVSWMAEDDPTYAMTLAAFNLKAPNTVLSISRKEVVNWEQ